MKVTLFESSSVHSFSSTISPWTLTEVRVGMISAPSSSKMSVSSPSAVYALSTKVSLLSISSMSLTSTVTLSPSSPTKSPMSIEKSSTTGANLSSKSKELVHVESIIPALLECVSTILAMLAMPITPLKWALLLTVTPMASENISLGITYTFKLPLSNEEEKPSINPLSKDKAPFS